MNSLCFESQLKTSLPSELDPNLFALIVFSFFPFATPIPAAITGSPPHWKPHNRTWTRLMIVKTKRQIYLKRMKFKLPGPYDRLDNKSFKGVHILISRTYQNVTLHGKNVFLEVIKILKWGDCSGLSKCAQCKHKSP